MKKLSVLHISDLHRDRENPIRNDVLLNSLENDRRNYIAEQIRPPDLVIVSGDLIQGIEKGTQDPDAGLREQYAEAIEFLAALTDRFLEGHRNRLVLVPGNHDVSADHFYRSLTRVEIRPDRKRELAKTLLSPGSRLRWSWSDFELYEIADKDLYAQRLAAFCEFYGEFYQGSRDYDLDPAAQVDLFDYPEFGLTVAGFSSCHHNDLLNRQGSIHPACIASATERLRDTSLQGRLRIAVWHHNAEGQPVQSDYMSPDLIQNLIDCDFSLGFHGHQHRPQFLETRFRHGEDKKITVISAGTLCGGPSFRYGRAYNLVEFDTTMHTGRLHVREMQNDNLNLPIWGRRFLRSSTEGCYEFKYHPPPEPVAPAGVVTALLMKAQRLHDSGEYKEAGARSRKVGVLEAVGGV